MPRQALIQLRRGTGLPANNALAEGELAIDISAKKLYSANSTGYAFTLSGDQYNLAQGGNSTQGTVTLNVDNDSLSNDSVTFAGTGGITISGNSTQMTFNAAAGTDYDLSAGGTAATGTLGTQSQVTAQQGTLSTGATPAGGSDNITVFHLATEDNRVTNTTQDGAVTNKKLNLDYSNATYRAPTVDTATQAGGGWSDPQKSDTTWELRKANATTNYGVNDVLVFLNGVSLTPGNDYTISGQTLTLTGGVPPVGSNLVVRYLPLVG